MKLEGWRRMMVGWRMMHEVIAQLPPTFPPIMALEGGLSPDSADETLWSLIRSVSGHTASPWFRRFLTLLSLWFQLSPIWVISAQHLMCTFKLFSIVFDSSRFISLLFLMWVSTASLALPFPPDQGYPVLFCIPPQVV